MLTRINPSALERYLNITSFTHVPSSYNNMPQARYVSRADVKETMQSLVDRVHDRGVDAASVRTILDSNVQIEFTLEQMTRLFHIMIDHIRTICIVFDMLA